MFSACLTGKPAVGSLFVNFVSLTFLVECKSFWWLLVGSKEFSMSFFEFLVE